MEDRGQLRHVRQVRLWRAPRILDELSLVHGRTYIAYPSWVDSVHSPQIAENAVKNRPRWQGYVSYP